MKKIVFLLMLLSSSLYGQKVSVAESEEKIEDVSRKGLYTIIELDDEQIRTAWVKKLKEFGACKNKTGIYIVEQATIGAISSTFVKIISKIETTTKGIKVWYALDLGDSYVSSSGDQSKYKEATKILKDFALSVYLQDINEQIREAEKVLTNSVKDQEKMMAKGESIRAGIFTNRQEKIKLEKKLSDNAIEYKQLKSDSLLNIQNQAFAAETVEKMKRAVEAVRLKISKVE